MIEDIKVMRIEFKHILIGFLCLIIFALLYNDHKKISKLERENKKLLELVETVENLDDDLRSLKSDVEKLSSAVDDVNSSVDHLNYRVRSQENRIGAIANQDRLGSIWP